MNISAINDNEFAITGQVIQSLPGGHCMRCCQLINDEKLTREVERYGDAGPEPQVVWANGVLASTAVGWGITILSPWHRQDRLFRWLAYDGNSGELTVPSLLKNYLDYMTCPHHPLTEVGDPLCDVRRIGNSFSSSVKAREFIWEKLFSFFSRILKRTAYYAWRK